MKDYKRFLAPLIAPPLITLILAICLIICAMVSATNTTATAAEMNSNTSSTSSVFVVVEKDFLNHYSVVYHKESKVMYILSQGAYNSGNFMVMLDDDGTPVTYKGD